MLKLFLIARIASMKEMITSQSGVKVLNFSVANDRYSNGETVTDFFNVVAFNGSAEFISKYFKKGQLIAIDGTLTNNHYEDTNGIRHFSEKIVVSHVEFAGYNKSYIKQGD